MILSQKNIEEIAVAVIRDFQKSFFGSEADDPARFALPTPIDQFASDYLNLKVSFQKLSSDGSIYGLTAYVDTEYQIEVDGSQRSIFLKTNDVVLDKSFIEPANIRKLCGKRRFLSTGSKMMNGLFHGCLSFGWKQQELRPLGQPTSRKREHKKAEHC